MPRLRLPLAAGRAATLVFTTRADGDLSVNGEPDALSQRRAAVTAGEWTWLRQVHGAGVVVFASSGNGGNSAPNYPAANANVISVAAVDLNKNRSPYSTFGSTVDVAAPGGDTSVDRNADGYPDGVLGPEDGVPTLIMGYEYYPESLAGTIRRAWEYTKGEVPILVTENGIGTDDDQQRIDYVRTALEGVLDCIDEGIDVRGYTYWSLLDNFEWAFGYGPRFGLVEVDRTTFERRPKPSARWFAGVVAANAL